MKKEKLKVKNNIPRCLRTGLLILFSLFICSCSRGVNSFSVFAQSSQRAGNTNTMNVDRGLADKQIYLAGGCFWGTEKYLSLINGVVYTEVGYANGRTAFPSYEDVSYRNTGHTEAVLVEYNSAILDLAYLLDLFYESIDPTLLNRQGNDIGTQYRTGIYYVDEVDRVIIEASIAQLSARTPAPVVIEVLPLNNYYTAEEYHQKYLEKNPWGYCHISSNTFEWLIQTQSGN